MASSVKTVDEYISAYDGELKERMIALRALIHSCHRSASQQQGLQQKEDAGKGRRNFQTCVLVYYTCY